MELLRVPYVLNILILLPIAPLTLLGGQLGNGLVFEGKCPESPGARTILGSIWTSILLISAAGVFFPAAMAPVLLLQVLYKSLWLLVYVVPRAIKGRMQEIPGGVAITFVIIVATYPWVIPWARLFARS